MSGLARKETATAALSSASSRRLQGYLAGRCAVLCTVIALATAFWVRRGEFPLAPEWFFGLTAGAFGFTLASAAVLRRRWHIEGLARVQPLWDTAYATGLVYISGGALSPLASLYQLVVIGGAILFSRSGAVLLAGACSVAYGLLVDLQFYGVLGPPNALPIGVPGGSDLVLHLLFTIASLFAVALLTGFLAEELRRAGRRLAQVEAEFLDLEHLKDSILRSLPSGLVALDEEDRELFHNRAAEELLLRAGVRLDSRKLLEDVFERGEGGRKEVVLEGGKVVLGYTVSPLFNREGQARGNILIFQDLTQVKRLENELRRADRLAAVGRLAAGLAHEIRNPLASLSGSVEVLGQNLNPAGEDGELFRIVLRETARLNRLVTDFLHYARPDRGRRSEVELRSLVDEVAFFFLQGEGKEGFQLTNLIPGGTTMTADRGQLEQLFLNLFRNSVEACADGIKVTVDARQEQAGAVSLLVRDDGPGLSREVSARAFEPFYSTKQNGTGLGLATVHRIVENHGGSVRLESEAGQGTSFHFSFPM